MFKAILLSATLLTGVLGRAQAPAPPDTFDSIARGFANSLCASTGCVVKAEASTSSTTYRSRIHDPLNSPPIIPAGGRFVDERGGGNRNISVDLTGPIDRPGQLTIVPWSDECFNHIAAYDCATINQSDLFSGYSIGNPSGEARSQGWAASTALTINKFSPSAGISSGLTLNVTKNGIGDIHGIYAYVFSRGGVRAASDEALELLAANGGESGPPAFAGAITEVDPSHTRVLLRPLRANGSQGIGRMLIDTTPSSLVASGCLTRQDYAHDPAGKKLDVTEYSLGCGASVKHLAKSWGTLTTDIDPPILPSTSDTSPTTTDSVADLYSFSGTPDVGDIGCFSGVVLDGFHEAAKIVAVAPGTGPKHFKVTYAARVRHPKGSFVVNGTTGCLGIEIKANTYGTPDEPQHHNGLRYVIDTLGCPNDHTCWSVQFQGAGSGGVYPVQMAMNVMQTAAPLTNKDGFVAIPIKDIHRADFPIFVGAPTITISNADDPTFNGPCTDTHSLSNAPPDILFCRQPASTGHTSATSNATLTVGDTGYGNTRFNLFYEAQVLDLKDYSKSPPQFPAGPILRLEANGMPLPVGGTVEEPNDYAAGYYGLHMGLWAFNPYASFSLYSAEVGPVMDTRFAAGDVINRADTSHTMDQYAGLGGTRQPPRGYTLHGFPWASFGQMDTLPWPAGAAIFSVANCPQSPLGCGDPGYTALIGGYPGKDVYYRDRWTPYTDTRSFEGPHHTFPEAPTVTGKMKFACFNDKMELVAKVTPCDQDP
jgi:hypothetical protein